jgi:hypothetical protein
MAVIFEVQTVPIHGEDARNAVPNNGTLNTARNNGKEANQKPRLAD